MSYHRTAMYAFRTAIMADGVGAPSFGEGAGMYTFTKDKARSHAAHNRRFSWQGESLANAVNGFDAGAVCTDQICHLEIFQLVRSPIQLFIRRREQVQSTNDCGYWLVGEFPPGKCQYVD